MKNYIFRFEKCQIVKKLWHRESGKGCPMNLLVTGGAGFIGSNFILYWLRQHPADRIVCLDKLTYAGHVSTLAPVWDRPNFRFVQADIGDPAAVGRLFAEEHPDVVVNFAAESHVDRSIADPTLFYRTNVLGTVTLLEACRQYGVRRFHQISTDEVYGALPLEGGRAFTETSPLRPSSPYSSSKAAAELAALAYFRTYGVPVTVSRSSNNYGRYQYPEKLIPRIIQLALRNEPLPVYGDGRNVRDWLAVEDHCRALDLVLHRGRVGEIYNVGGGNERSNLEVVRLICRTLGKPESRIRFVEDRKGHDRRYALDCAKIREELGWEPRTELEEGMQKTIEWYEEEYGER